MLTDLETYYLKTIEKELDKDSANFLNIFRLAQEKKLFNEDYFELFFIQALDKCIARDWAENLILVKKEIFGLTAQRASKLVQDYLNQYMNNMGMDSHKFVVVDNLLESSVLNGLFFEGTFLRQPMFTVVLNEEKIDMIIARSKENFELWLDTTMKKKNVEEEKVKL